MEREHGAKVSRTTQEGAGIRGRGEAEADAEGGEGGGAGPVLQLHCGVRATEEALLRAVLAHAAAARAEPALLARPVRIVVPSRSLREHVGAALVRRAGGALAGVALETLHALAIGILERAGERPPRGDALFPIVVRQLARAEPALRERLEAYEDGYAVVAESVKDLLDAGFAPHDEEPFLECLASAGSEAPPHAAAVLRVAARAARAMERLGLGRGADLLRRARERLEADPEGALPARAVLVHGFADATGVAGDLLETLGRLCGACFLLDLPPDPGAVEKPRRVEAFAAPLRERLRGIARLEDAGEIPALPRLRLLRAPGAQAEVRAVAERIHALLEGGARPEAVAVVARDLSPYTTAIRLHLRRLGIPFSGVGAGRGPAGAAARRVEAFLELLRRGRETPAERWLEARGAGRSEELRVALHALGAARLGDVAALDPQAALDEAGRLALPVRRGLWAPEAEEGGAEAERVPHAVRRKLEGAELRKAAQAARELLRVLEAASGPASLAEQLGRLRSLTSDTLAWHKDPPGAAEVRGALDSLAAELPAALPLAFDEVVLLLVAELDRAGASELGGAGGGVQVLSVTEARGRSFEQLFVVGVNRDVFPRLVREDPLLSDPLRGRLAELARELPIKRRGFDEEQHLFAQLLSASPEVTLSWQAVSDDGKPLAASPLIERLRLAERVRHGRPPTEDADDEIETAPALLAHAAPRLRSAQEQLVLAGLRGASRERVEALLEVALREAWHEAGGRALAPQEARELAAARQRVREELDPGLREAARLGPYFGWLGPMGGPLDPRAQPLYLTRIEQLVTCPWQTFLSRLLQLEALPDALESLPEASPPVVGRVAHAALQEIACRALPDAPEQISDAQARAAVAVPWPDDASLDRILRGAAEQVLRDEGIGLLGFARVLAVLARPFVLRARELDWDRGEGAPAVLGAEVEGRLELTDASGRSRELRFRADRVDLVDGRLRLTDYKTGTPLSNRKQAETRRRHLLEAVRAGRWLQAPGYALLAGAPRAEGRWLFLDPELDEDVADVAVGSQDDEALAAFRHAVTTTLGAFDAGAFFPRLVTPDGVDEPGACERCEVKEACLRGDSGARARLVRWAAAAREAAAAGVALPAGERALLGLWRLPAKDAAAAERGEGAS